MNIKKTIISVVAILVAVSIYGALIWFGFHSDELRNHEKEIGALPATMLRRCG